MRSFFDFSFDGRREGRVVLELFTDRMPETCKVFQSLCSSDTAVEECTDVDGKSIKMHYKDTPVHYVSANLCIMGDVSKRGGKSPLFQGGFYSDECLNEPLLPFDEPYLLATAPVQPDVKPLSKKERKLQEASEAPQEQYHQTSQFLITRSSGQPLLPNEADLKQQPRVFGKVIKGHQIINALCNQSHNEKGKPYPELIMNNCGNLQEGDDDNWLFLNGGDPYPNWPEDCYPSEPDHEHCLRYATEIKQVGNEKIALGHFWFAMHKYEKAVRYLDFKQFNDNPLEAEVRRLKAQCYLNMIHCHLKNRKYHLVLSEVDKYFERDELNELFDDKARAKLLYRRALAHIKTDELQPADSVDLNNIELACADLEEAMKLSDDPTVKQLYQQVKDKVKQKHDAEVSKYSSMFKDKIQDGDKVEVFSSDAVKSNGW